MPRGGAASGGPRGAGLPKVAACSRTAGARGSVAEYLAAREPHDRDVLTPADAAGAVAVGARARARARSRSVASCRWATRAAPCDGWESPHTVVEVVSDDAPFLVDSVSSALARRGYDIHLLFRPLLDVAGRRRHVAPAHRDRPRDRPRRARRAARRDRERRRRRVRGGGRLGRAPRSRSTDFADASARRHRPSGVGADETAEVATYLDWLADDHFTFVGGGGASTPSGVAIAGVGAGRRPPPAAVRPRRRRSRAHRAPHPHPRAGAVDGAPRRAARLRHRPTPRRRRRRRRRAAPARPLHRQRLQRQRRAHPRRAPEGRRGGGAVRAPRPTATTGARSSTCSRRIRATSCSASRTDELAELALAIVGMGMRRRVRLFVSRDRVGCFVSCLVYLPRDRYTTPVRSGDRRRAVRRVRRRRRRLHRARHRGGDGAPARRRSRHARRCARRSKPFALEAKLAALARDWVDDLHDAFVDTLGEEAGRRPLPARGATRSRPRTRPRCPRPTRSRDVAVLEHLDPDGDLQLRLEPPDGDGASPTSSCTASGGALVLSDVMPLLEHLGVTVVDEHPYEIAAPDGPRAGSTRSASWPPPAIRSPTRRRRRASPRCSSACGRARSRTTASTGSCCTPGSTSRDVVIVRALCQYLRQAGVRFTDAYLADTLHDNAEAVRLLVARFHARLDPRPRRRARRPPRRGAARRRARARDRRGREPRRRPHPARALAARAGDGAHERVPGRARTSRASSTRPRSTSCRSRTRSTRSGSRRRRSRACTCAPATSRVAASGGRTDARTSAPRSSG